ASVIGKNKKVLVEEFHMVDSLFRTHRFHIKPFVFYYRAALVAAALKSPCCLFFTFTVIVQLLFIFHDLFFELFDYLIYSRIHLAGLSLSLDLYAIDFQKHFGLVPVFLHTQGYYRLSNIGQIFIEPPYFLFGITSQCRCYVKMTAIHNNVHALPPLNRYSYFFLWFCGGILSSSLYFATVLRAIFIFCAFSLSTII